MPRRRPYVAGTTPIDFVPMDIWSLIFKELQYTSPAEVATIQSWMEDDAIPQQTFLPYLLASVCPLWRDTLCCQTTFWRRLVFDISSTVPSPTCLDIARIYTHHSGGQPLYIAITRVSHLLMAVQNEKAHISAILDHLLPHASRWRTLRIDVTDQDTLPTQLQALSGNAPLLAGLRLESEYFNAPLQLPLLFNDFQRGVPIDLPLLETLHLDGPSFLNTYLLSANARSLTSVTSLAIAGYKSSICTAFKMIDLVAFLVQVPRLSRLKLADIEFHEDQPFEMAPSRRITGGLRLQSLVLDNIGQMALATLFTTIHDYRCVWLTFIRCYPHVHLNISSTEHLRIEHAPPRMFFGAPLATAANFDGVNSCDLTFSHCNIRNEIEAMSMPMYGNTWSCSHVTKLRVHNCVCDHRSIFRVLWARRVAHAQTAFAEHDSPSFVVASIKWLSVIMIGEELSDKEKEWLNASVEYVEWNVWVGGYGGHAR